MRPLVPLALAAALAAAEDRLPVAACNVAWDSPGGGPAAAMPIGNGEVAANVWCTAEGVLTLLVARGDAYGSQGQPLKVAQLELTLEPSPFAGPGFRQELRLDAGELRLAGAGATVAVRADAHHPVLWVEIEAPRPLAAALRPRVWRTAERMLPAQPWWMAFYGSPPRQEPDEVLATGGTLAVVHRNRTSIWADTMRTQRLEGLVPGQQDPLLGLAFGALARGDGLAADGQGLAAPPARRHRLAVAVVSARAPTAAAWSATAAAALDAAWAEDPAENRARHQAWWRAFWQRSWVRVAANDRAPRAPEGPQPFWKPVVDELRLGADNDGGEGFTGLIAEAAIYPRALAAGELDALRAGLPPPGARWSFSATAGATGLAGDAALVEADGARALRLGGKGWLAAPGLGRLDPATDLTLAVRFRAEAPSGRLLDAARPGAWGGLVLDLQPDGLRLITGDGRIGPAAKPAPGRWAWATAVLTHEGRLRVRRLALDGAHAAWAWSADPCLDDGALITRGYALARYLLACQGRSSLPIRFNGGLFTVEPGVGDPQRAGIDDPDWRAWGGAYWAQNTRHMYQAMLAAGDADLMEPFWRHYRGNLDLALARTRRYCGHGGAFFPEIMTHWGSYTPYDFSLKGTVFEPTFQLGNQWIRWHWQNGLEAAMLMLDRYEADRDAGFLAGTALPVAAAVVEFYDRHYPRVDGRLRLSPGMALETWQDADDPMPEVAGLHAVLPRLIALDHAEAAARRADWRRLLAELPGLPQDAAGRLQPARRFDLNRNCENPELYAVHPYRLRGVGLPGLEDARAAYAARRNKVNRGWQQDVLFAARLGLREDAARQVAQRYAETHPSCRFPGFHGPNFDWMPDQQHAAIANSALHAMLLQEVGGRLLVLPGWPRGWDVEARLHASGGTVVDLVYRDGRLERLDVTPIERRAAVETMLPE